MSALAQDLRALLVACHDDPLLFAESVLRAKPRVWQRRVLEAIRERLRAGDTRIELLVRACHSAGKSWIVGVLTIWYMSTRPEARGMTLGPSWRIVEEITWPEIRRLFAGSLLADLNIGRCLSTSLEFGPAWFCSGAASDRPETLEGAHSPTAALRVCDETKAVPDEVLTVTQGSLASPESFDAWISTPNLRTGAFYQRDIFGGDRVLRFVVTAADLIEEGIPGIKEWALDCAAKWGVDSPAYLSRVNAQYVEESGGSLYPFSHVERAIAQTWEVGGVPVGGMDCAGSVDGDESVLALATGPDERGRQQVRIAGAWKERDTMISKGRALALLRTAGASSVGVDAIGLGKGVADALREDLRRKGEYQAPCNEYRASDAAKDSVQFSNCKAEDAWNIRELLEKGLLRLPADSVTRAQFMAMRYEINSRGQIRVVDPSDSPDRHDAIAISLNRKATRGESHFEVVYRRSTAAYPAAPRMRLF